MAISASAAAQGIGIKMENMNPAVKPGTDFYQYACGGWIKNNPLKPEFSRFGSFDVVAENNKNQIKSCRKGLPMCRSSPVTPKSRPNSPRLRTSGRRHPYNWRRWADSLNFQSCGQE